VPGAATGILGAHNRMCSSVKQKKSITGVHIQHSYGETKSGSITNPDAVIT